jgi:threonine dehydratase
VTIPEKPGSFKAFCEAIGKRQITEFNYRYNTGSEAHIFVGVQTHPENDPRSALIASLTEQGFPVIDLTDNELAKLHIRHMVGGHAARWSMKWCCASNSRSVRGAVQLPQQARRALEHLDVPLPQPRRS